MYAVKLNVAGAFIVYAVILNFAGALIVYTVIINVAGALIVYAVILNVAGALIVYAVILNEKLRASWPLRKKGSRREKKFEQQQIVKMKKGLTTASLDTVDVQDTSPVEAAAVLLSPNDDQSGESIHYI